MYIKFIVKPRPLFKVERSLNFYAKSYRANLTVFRRRETSYASQKVVLDHCKALYWIQIIWHSYCETSKYITNIYNNFKWLLVC